MSPMLEMVGSFWKVGRTIEVACKVGLQADDRMFDGVGKRRERGNLGLHIYYFQASYDKYCLIFQPAIAVNEEKVGVNPTLSLRYSHMMVGSYPSKRGICTETEVRTVRLQTVMLTLLGSLFLKRRPLCYSSNGVVGTCSSI